MLLEELNGRFKSIKSLEKVPKYAGASIKDDRHRVTFAAPKSQAMWLSRSNFVRPSPL